MLSAATSVAGQLSVTFCPVQLAADASMTFVHDEYNDGSLSCWMCQ